ncbi:MAG: ribose-5-phosphate isomerase [Bacillota bacterium]|nr:ribose-5-phosphate isomerase [Bacillota bacterium]
MDIISFKEERYENIIGFICRYKGMSKEHLKMILKDRECKYLLFLLLEKYKCLDLDKILKDFDIVSKKSLRYNMKKAEEKFFLNREFREAYFELEEMAKKII